MIFAKQNGRTNKIKMDSYISYKYKRISNFYNNKLILDCVRITLISDEQTKYLSVHLSMDLEN